MNTKHAMREEHTAYRRHLRSSPDLKRNLDAAISSHLRRLLSEVTGHNVAAYSPLPTEPGGKDMIPAAAEAARTLFLPISLPGGALRWSPLSAAPNTTGAFGIAEPTGARFNSNVLRSCRAVVVPALAVDAAGMRLGKGSGYYDRALAGLEVPTIAVVYARELVDAVQSDPHDVPVSAVVTENGITRFRGNR